MKETLNQNKLQESSWMQLMEDNDKMTKTELQTAQKKSWKMTVCANHTNYFSTALHLQWKLKLQPPVCIPLWNQGCIHPMSHAVITISFVTEVFKNEKLLHWNGTLSKELAERLSKELICSDNGSWLYPRVLPLIFLPPPSSFSLSFHPPPPPSLPMFFAAYFNIPLGNVPSKSQLKSLSSFSLVKVKASVAGVRSDQPSKS